MLRRFRQNNVAGYAAGLLLREIQSGAVHAAVKAKLDGAPVLPQETLFAAYRREEQAKPAGSIFFQTGESLLLPQGTAMVWRTLGDAPAKN